MWIPVYKRSTPRSATMSSPGWAFRDVSLGLVLGALQNPWFFLRNEIMKPEELQINKSSEFCMELWVAYPLGDPESTS